MTTAHTLEWSLCTALEVTRHQSRQGNTTALHAPGTSCTTYKAKEKCTHLEQAVHFEIAHVIRAAHARLVVRRALVVSRGVVRGVVDAANAADARAAKVDDAGMAEVVNVGRGPAAVVQLPEVICRLVVAANCTCQRRARCDTQCLHGPRVCVARRLANRCIASGWDCLTGTGAKLKCWHFVVPQLSCTHWKHVPACKVTLH